MDTNLLYYGGNLDILRRYISDLVYPETDGRVMPRHPDAMVR